MTFSEIYEMTCSEIFPFSTRMTFGYWNANKNNKNNKNTQLCNFSRVCNTNDTNKQIKSFIKRSLFGYPISRNNPEYFAKYCFEQKR